MQVRDGAAERAQRIRFLLLDADGILTDGRIYVGPRGEEWKAFDARDGLGIRLAQSVGLGVGILSGRRSEAVERRANELKLEEVHQGVLDKLRVFETLLVRRGLQADEVAYAGDDLVDLAVLCRAGLSATVPDSTEEVRAQVHLVTGRGGGRGAVRELVEFVLRAQGRWEGLVAGFGQRAGRR